MATNPLSTESILKHMAEALPTHKKDDTNSDLSSSYEAVALFAHACMTAVGFRLLGFSEGKSIEEECRSITPRLSDKWNANFNSHSFLYAHQQSSMQYVIKVDRLGGKAEIRGIALGNEMIVRFEIVAKDYVSSSALPLRIKMTENGEDRSDLEAKLKEVFISPSRIQDLASDFKLQIIQKLLPSLQKEGYQDSRTADEIHEEREAYTRDAQHARNPRPRQDPDALPQPARPYPFNDPLADGPRRPMPTGDFPPPGFDDEYDLERPLRGMAPGFPGARAPFGIGHDDLHPPGLGPGAHDPLRIGGIGGGGFGGGNGGMHPTFDDPLFGGGRGNGRGYDPQAPPGSRYDPVGPGDGPPRGNGGRPPNPFGGFGGNDFI
ncbi:hypothetical protein PVAG01_08518 [Phlyctema vagabunda]|uniref:Proteasome inhibitor PI31 subunit n=1 Tax=Phlyctema vagabunda TaxID=108571 RepID=A0ABR4P9M6_9HELO